MHEGKCWIRQGSNPRLPTQREQMDLHAQDRVKIYRASQSIASRISEWSPISPKVGITTRPLHMCRSRTENSYRRAAGNQKIPTGRGFTLEVRIRPGFLARYRNSLAEQQEGKIG